jgi:tetratricopeptide (TPR) repeat protein
MFISPEYTISRTGKQIAGLVEPDSLLFGNFAHALTAATRLRAQHLFKVRYGDGQLEQSFAELGTTHLIFDCDDSSPIPEVFAQQGLPLEELDRYYIQGTEVRLFRLGGIAASRSPYETALQALRNEELDRAEKLFTECLAQNPRSAATWHQLGIVALRRGDGERGYKCLIEAIVHDPTRVHAHRDTAKLLAQNGHHTQALAHLRAAMAVTPGDEGLARQVAGIENELGRAHAQGDSRE